MIEIMIRVRTNEENHLETEITSVATEDSSGLERRWACILPAMLDVFADFKGNAKEVLSPKASASLGKHLHKHMAIMNRDNSRLN